ncbi:DUF4178 domain-containing protein [Kitasatospora terrestris]|uniref:DUF4178 domain-containing protein n=1 Tax=Kitasatospora terrestris TaxID=258051 RepID=A0ABP9E6Q6_9ACTN
MTGLMDLRPGDTLPGGLSVRGAVQVGSATQRWAEYLLTGEAAGTGTTLWLAVEALPDGTERSSYWHRTTAEAAGFDPDLPTLDGQLLAVVERGHGDYRAVGEFGGLPGLRAGTGRLHYVDYTGPGLRASLEYFGPAGHDAPGSPGLLGVEARPPA